jgi:hypothetical protein
LPITLAWDIASRFIKPRRYRALLVLALVSGGTGLSPLMHLIIEQPHGMDPGWSAAERLIASQRFIGNRDQPNANSIPAALGETLFPPMATNQKTSADFEARELPQETFGYQFFVGDYHPPLGGFFLLLLALALIAALETEAIGATGQALLGITLPAVIATNTWVLPLQAVLIAAWVAYRYWRKTPPNWAMLAGGGMLGFALIYPFLAGFAAHAIDTPIRFVSMQDHTPLSRFIGQHWPLMALILLGLIQPSTRKLSITFALTFGFLLLMSELIYVDDPSGGKYERTNTTMKWWGWIWAGGLVSLGVLSLASQARFARWGAAATLGLVSLLSYDVARYFVLTGKADLGRLDGYHWIVRDNGNRGLFNYLHAAPNGIVLENQYGDAYTTTTTYALFAGKPALLGWPAHLQTWHGDVSDAWQLQRQIKSFYAGELANSLDWLLANHVYYVVWSPAENGKHPDAFAEIGRQIGGAYAWHGFYDAADAHVGVWVRKQ